MPMLMQHRACTDIAEAHANGIVTEIDGHGPVTHADPSLDRGSLLSGQGGAERPRGSAP